MQLLGEEIDTQVAVLTSSGRGGDADDLARAVLKDQEITETNVVAWDGDGVWWERGSLRTIFIVVTHLGGLDLGRLDCLS